MVQTKLTLRLEDTLIQRAKSYSKESGKSLSQLVAGFFRALTEEDVDRPAELTPIVRSLKGSLRGAEVDEEDYRRHLDDKYL